MTFIGNSDLEQYLNIDVGASWETWVNNLAVSIQADAERLVGYEFTKHFKTTYFDGLQRRVWLPVPAKAIDFSEPMALAVFDDLTNAHVAYELPPLPRLMRDGSIDLYGLGYGPEAVEVTYAVGWDQSTFPKDLKQALVELLAAKWSTANAASSATGADTDVEAPVKAISVDGFRKEYVVADATTASTQLQGQVESAMNIIRGYRRARVF